MHILFIIFFFNQLYYVLHQHDKTVLDITADILQYSRFCDIVKDVFPKVRPREYKSVSGKCDICEKLRAALKECTLKSDRITLMRYRLFHRNKYMGEKIKYYQRY